VIRFCKRIILFILYFGASNRVIETQQYFQLYNVNVIPIIRKLFNMFNWSNSNEKKIEVRRVLILISKG